MARPSSGARPAAAPEVIGIGGWVGGGGARRACQLSGVPVPCGGRSVIDVGGQRMERPKWNLTGEITAVIFVCALTEYNQARPPPRPRAASARSRAAHCGRPAITPRSKPGLRTAAAAVVLHMGAGPAPLGGGAETRRSPASSVPARR
jgi:hypothetical protein